MVVWFSIPTSTAEETGLLLFLAVFGLSDFVLSALLVGGHFDLHFSDDEWC
jgi:hypothetical protein